MSKQSTVLVACPTWKGGEYALRSWAQAFKDQTYPAELRRAFMVDNSEDNPSGLHYAHTIRGQGIYCAWQPKCLPVFWDTMELCWAGPNGIVEYAHDNGYDFIFSIEHDVIVAPEAMQIMVDTAWEHAVDGKPAVVSHQVNPRGQNGPDFHWDTLACTLLPTEPLWLDRMLTKSNYEIEVFIVEKRHGYPRVRVKDLFEIIHMKDPEDRRGDDKFSATPAYDTYAMRKMEYNQMKIPEKEEKKEKKEKEEKEEKKPEGSIALDFTPQPDEKKVMQAGPASFVGQRPKAKASAVLTAKKKKKSKPKMRVEIPSTTDEFPINLLGVNDEAELVKILGQESRIRLNLGCGFQQIAGFIGVDFDPNVDPEVCSRIDDLSWLEDDTVDMIYASHVLEHLTFEESKEALKEWNRVLKPGGWLDVAVPDIVQVYYMWRKGSQWGDYQQFVDEVYINATAFGANLLAEVIPEMKDMYGGPGHQHKQIFLYDMLLQRVLDAGFVEVHEVTQNFLRHSAWGETMVQGRKIWFPDTGEIPTQPQTKEK